MNSRRSILQKFNLDILPPEIQCQIISKLQDPYTILNLLETGKEYQNLVYDCVTEIVEDPNKPVILTADLILRMQNLQYVNTEIYVNSESELYALASTPLVSLNLILGPKIVSDHKRSLLDVQFMSVVSKFIKIWIREHPASEDFFLQTLESPLQELHIRSTIDNKIEFNYDRGTVSLTEYQLGSAIDITFDMLEDLNRANALNGLEFSTLFMLSKDLQDINTIRSSVEKYKKYFLPLDGVKSIGINYAVGYDIIIYLILLWDLPWLTQLYYFSTGTSSYWDIFKIGTWQTIIDDILSPLASDIISGIIQPVNKNVDIRLPLASKSVNKIMIIFPQANSVGVAFNIFDNPTKFVNNFRLTYPNTILVLFIYNPEEYKDLESPYVERVLLS